MKRLRYLNPFLIRDTVREIRRLSSGGGPKKLRLVRVGHPEGILVPTAEITLEVESKDGSVARFSPGAPGAVAVRLVLPGRAQARRPAGPLDRPGEGFVRGRAAPALKFFAHVDVTRCTRGRDGSHQIGSTGSRGRTTEQERWKQATRSTGRPASISIDELESGRRRRTCDPDIRSRGSSSISLKAAAERTREEGVRTLGDLQRKVRARQPSPYRSGGERTRVDE